MANHERYPHAHRDLESVSAARAFLGPHGELISARLAYALAPPKPMPAQAERGVSADGRDPLERALTHLAEVRSKRSRQVEARVAAAARTARRLITEITRLATVVSEVEEQVARELEEEGFDGESTLVLAVFDALARRDREGIPFGIPSKAEFDALSSVLGDFVERTGAKTKRKRRPGQSKRSESFDPFDLTVALALLVVWQQYRSLA